MSEDLNGLDYRALRRLSNAADETLADVGETCERVPASSLARLLASGDRIELAQPKLAKSTADAEPARPKKRRALKSEKDR